jgi:mevalonate kinase
MMESPAIQSYFAHGKLLLTAEYFVLDGAKSLALPTRLGQKMDVHFSEKEQTTFGWKAYRSDGSLWLDIVFEKANLLPNTDTEEATRLQKILLAVSKQAPPAFREKALSKIETKLDFPNEWGLGSSSTLLSLLAQYANINPYLVLNETIGGSGYDIACATAESALLYERNEVSPIITAVDFSPPFKSNLFFAYLGKKQLSTEGIAHYRTAEIDKKSAIKWLDVITESILNCVSLDKMNQLIVEHETIVSEALHLTPVKQKLFPDYWGEVKSLGAWGGDFVLLTNNRSREELTHYLTQKNIEVVFSFDELFYTQ